MNKKLVISINTSWNIINFRMGLLKALQTEGYEIIVVAPKDKYSALFKTHDFEYHDISINNKGSNPIEDIKLIVDYYKLFKEIKPDVILNYTIKPNIYGTIAASLLNLKTINNIAGLGTLFVAENIITKIAKYLYKYSQLKASYVFFQNSDDFKLFTDEKLVDINKCGILPGSGVDTNLFKPIEVIRDDDKVVFLLIARMLWNKGIKEYIEAARVIKQKYPYTEFQLLGFLDVANKSAISKDQMDKWIDEGVINYLGTSDNVKVEISNADCIVLPSFYREGTPRTLLESASMAKPIITTDNVGCRDVVDNGKNGFIVKVKDVDSLVQNLEIFINLTKEEKLILGQNGRNKIIQEYDEKIVISKYIKIINRL
ncbi:MAG: glycosyltransferase family 4 protein [Campylobacterota bacterium]|nr:glycosyltransferase family 4 protein [Campylobacterota bacterium]